jgi:hypothetical protein
VAETTDLAEADALLGRELTGPEIDRLIGEMSLKDLAIAVRAGETEFRQLAGPATVELMRRSEADPKALVDAGYGDIAKLVAAILIDSRFKNAPLYNKGTRAQHRLHREALEGENPTPIESLLAARAALDWLHLHLHELTYSGDLDNTSLRGREHLERVRDRLHRRYMLSLKTLASVRRLNLPGATFIVGGVQQVNLTGGPPAALPGTG